MSWPADMVGGAVDSSSEAGADADADAVATVVAWPKKSRSYKAEVSMARSICSSTQQSV